MRVLRCAPCHPSVECGTHAYSPQPHVAVCCPECACRYDDLSNYVNERSAWLGSLRESIEEPWQAWELGQLLSSPDVAQGVAGGDLGVYRSLQPDTLKQELKAR